MVTVLTDQNGSFPRGDIRLVLTEYNDISIHSIAGDGDPHITTRRISR